MEETTKVEAYLKDLLNVMVSRAEKEVDAVMPGYTHLQVSRVVAPLRKLTAASPTGPMVAPPPLARPIVPLRPGAPASTRPPNLGPPARLGRLGR
jgi:hypothetical protein